MQLTGLTELLRSSHAYRQLVEDLTSGTHALNVLRAARPFLVAALAQDTTAPIIYITARGKRAHNTAEQLPVWIDSTRPILRFAEPTPMFYDRIPWDRAVIQSRLETLAALMPLESSSPQGGEGQGEVSPILITSARALMQRTLPVSLFRQRSMVLKPGQQHDFNKLIQAWAAMGYEGASIVTEPGLFSRRGGILDIFPLSSRSPIRVEFFGDEIDTLRTFDPATQRSTETLKSVSIVPAREALPDLLPRLHTHLKTWFEQIQKVGQERGLAITQDIDTLQHGQSFPSMEYYLPYLYDQPASLLDYAPDDALIVVDDAEELQEVMAEISEEAAYNHDNNLKTGLLPDDYPIPYLDMPTLSSDLAARRVLYLNNTGRLPDQTSEAIVETSASRLFFPGGRFGGQVRPVLNYARDRQQHGERVVMVTVQTDRLRELWSQQDRVQTLAVVEDILTPPEPGSILLLAGTLAEGWTLNTGETALHLVTDAEIFNWARPEPRRRPVAKSGRRKQAAESYADWKEGEYVVHVDYGIGRFRGLRPRMVEGVEREYLLIEYDGTDLLFVPIHQADRLTRYVGPEEVPPRLHRIGKPQDWLKAKERAKQAALEEARELLTIYAKRAATHGHPFSPDTPWQHELEASFPYIETDDQLKALREVKHDMEDEMPMDRLVCGDVGYGKTEVALRAAFKAVMDGRQVAVLVPTTVLADQHYQTFSRRMAAFPIKVSMMSRFRTKAEITEALKLLANGEIDVMIGTHRLLSEDVKFKHLGLIVIDEEQRFGVKHKEHFKKLRANVDILTMTATPIPRTLYMSLSGVRDISMIQTPPEERLPVITHAGTYDPKIARQAILRELERGGQIFIIHNRVKTIESVRERFEELVPEASIVVAHGQMTGKMLEGIISDFSQGQYDILLATSIIENGIDMPNVNTLIVDRADWFGMSQLYQIRGRVGRGAQQAYCYFFHAGRLTEEARTRLDTLAEHVDLGSGFQIAMRDLELRGAGDILSIKQTGHIATVGLQLYTQLLQQAVADLRGNQAVSTAPTSARDQIIIDLPLPAYIPSDWIEEMALRLQLYRRIGNLQSSEEVAQLDAEMRDRFGPLPDAVEGLLYQMRVKLLANAIGATAILKPRQEILIKLPWLASVSRELLSVQLGSDVEVSRTAVELAYDPLTWHERLLAVMNEIKLDIRIPTMTVQAGA